MPQLFLEIVFWAVHWLVVLPVVLIAATPYVLIAAIFHKRRYPLAVLRSYRRICDAFAKFWNEGGWGFTP